MTNRYDELIASLRVSPQTRAVLLARLEPPGADCTPMLNTELFETLRAVIDRVIPQRNDAAYAVIDLAAAIDKKLSEGTGDGWRYASLPSDAEAWRLGLIFLEEVARRLNGTPFNTLAPAMQDALLEAIAAGRLRSEKLDLQRWFEDLRAAATEIFVAHPLTLARMRYSGIADEPNGFVQLGIGKLDAWEPR
jgi:hypothetical protein